MRLKRKFDLQNDNNIFWVTMTDLMTALVLVFIILFIYAYLNSNYDKIQSNIAKQESLNALKQNLEQNNIQASVDKASGVVKISDLELFDLNSYELSSAGEKYLEKFSPTYLDSLFSNEYMCKYLDKIIIQGHTDSQSFKGKFSDDEQYMKNMELSLKRAYAVANFMINTKYNKENGDKLRKMIIVEGASYAMPVIENGKENYDKSRRVELKLVMKINGKKDITDKS